MAATSSSHACKIPIVVVAVTMVALFFPTGEAAVKYGMCQAQCLEIQPNCSAWCKRIGYPDGGECVAPRFIDCCCWEIPPPEPDKGNGTATTAGLLSQRPSRM